MTVCIIIGCTKAFSKPVGSQNMLDFEWNQMHDCYKMSRNISVRSLRELSWYNLLIVSCLKFDDRSREAILGACVCDGAVSSWWFPKPKITMPTLILLFVKVVSFLVFRASKLFKIFMFLLARLSVDNSDEHYKREYLIAWCRGPSWAGVRWGLSRVKSSD